MAVQRRLKRRCDPSSPRAPSRGVPGIHAAPTVPGGVFLPELMSAVSALQSFFSILKGTGRVCCYLHADPDRRRSGGPWPSAPAPHPWVSSTRHPSRERASGPSSSPEPSGLHCSARSHVGSTRTRQRADRPASPGAQPPLLTDTGRPSAMPWEPREAGSGALRSSEGGEGRGQALCTDSQCPFVSPDHLLIKAFKFLQCFIR